MPADVSENGEHHAGSAGIVRERIDALRAWTAGGLMTGNGNMRRRPVSGDDAVGYVVADSSLGAVLVAGRGRGVCAVLLGDDAEALAAALRVRIPSAVPRTGDARLDALAAAVVARIELPARAVAVPLDVRGTPFQRAVWDALAEIPFGETASYTWLAARIGRPDSVRAVAQACAANALAVLIPCHRAVRRDGGLSGYRWGVERKRALLARERAAVELAVQGATGAPLFRMGVRDGGN